jgi:hypothetical protein
MKTADAAYWAGFVDGEGCLGLYTHNHRRQWVVVLQVANTNRGILEQLAENFGGSISTATQSLPNAKPCYTWYIASQKAMRVVRTILPHLKIKTRQAELLLEAGEIVSRRRQDGAHHWTPYPHRVLEIKRELTQLNKRGKK